ncbi:ABC transporter permease [Patescibacteria group bacterium]|nr:ABC transporter permease [Patescibacteria group bacterium]
MVILGLFKAAIKSLNINRWRSFLTMLGIIIGVAGVIMILSVGAGAQSLIFNEIESVGSNLVSVLPGASDDEGPPASAMGITVTTLQLDDLEAILNNDSTNAIVAGAGYVQGVANIVYQNQKVDTTFVGTTESYPIVENANLISGRWYTEVEDKGLSRLVVLGYQAALDTFGDIDPLNKKIKIKKEIFRVVGVVEERGSTFFGDLDNQVYIPLRTAQKIMLGINHISSARFQIDKEENVPAVIEEVKRIIRDQHDIDKAGIDDFSVRSQAQALDVLGSVTGALNFFLAAIAAIALLVGGVGIMNIMLVSVTERTAEIGLRKAVGAKPIVITTQFLVEAITLTFVGGAIGIIIGAFVAGLIALVANYLGYHWEFIVSISSILLSVGISVAIGIFFGLYPASKAAKLNPVEALRYE